MINEFLDGAMIPADEDNFLAMLSSSEELKSEFKKALFIDTTLKEDAAMIGPSTSATLKVFSALGISQSALVPKPSVTVRATRFVSRYFRKFAPAMVAAIIGSVITILTIGNQNDGQTTGRTTGTTGGSTTTTASQSTAAFPLMSSYAFENGQPESNTTAAPHADNQVQHVRRSHAVVPENTTTSGLAQTTADPSANNTINSINTVSSSQIINSSSGNDAFVPARRTLTDNHSTAPINLPVFEMSPAGQKLGLTVALSGYESTTIVKDVKKSESYSPLFSRNGVELTYKFSDDFSAGIDVRQEFFFQDFKGHESGKLYQYYQHPNILSGSITTKFSLVKISDNAGIIAKAAVGGSKPGIVFRAMLGLDYDPVEDFGFTVGIESSNLMYWHEACYVTPKIGLGYSLKFNL